MGFSAYGVTQSDDPLSQAIRGLIDHAQLQEEQIALLRAAVQKLTNTSGLENLQTNAKTTQEELARLNRLIE
jgi:serine O-acetyltransferase